MVHTITVRSDGTYAINAGDNKLLVPGFCPMSAELSANVDQIISRLSAMGAEEVHAEKINGRSFEHLLVDGLVQSNNFGQTILAEEFDQIIAQADLDYTSFMTPPDAPSPDL
jgi:hypothetical protein